MSEKKYHLNFDTKTFPGKIKCVEVTIKTDISGDLDKVYHLNLCDHPLYPALVRYVQSNPKSTLPE